MCNIALKTEYTFKKVFAPISKLPYKRNEVIGIADINNTFGHAKFEKECIKYGAIPMFGVRLKVVSETYQRFENHGVWCIFIAMTSKGLQEIYNLVDLAWRNFYYEPKLSLDNLYKLHPKDVRLIIENVISEKIELAFEFDYTMLSQQTQIYAESKAPYILLNSNDYLTLEDKESYELFSHPNTESKTSQQYLLTETELKKIIQNNLKIDAWKIENANTAIDLLCDIYKKNPVSLPKAEIVKYSETKEIAYEELLKKIFPNLHKIKELQQPITSEYENRLNYELNLIKEKDFVDYFLIVADMVESAKKTMLVGPARGSSAGSLVCYLLGITEIDPIKHGLIFERFIDVNRFDLPDIDIDFPDSKRGTVIKYLQKKYGKDKVRQLANINRMQPKSSINLFGKSLGIPPDDLEQIKGAIIERSGGDARAQMCIKDTFETTEVGKEFVKKYPKMKLVENIEAHASHSGIHAAGILVSNVPLSAFGGTNFRQSDADDPNIAGAIMLDKKDAEYLNLLKIDVLGLRTLSILEDAAKSVGMDFKDYYTLPLDDEKAFKVFNDYKFSGVFQYEGPALQTIVKSITITNFGDISAITALARPGALNSGGTARYIKYKTDKESPKYYCEIHKSITEETFGVTVYQEQMMEIARQIGNMTWEDVCELRKAASKSLGDEFFGRYRDKFIDGAMSKSKYSEEDAIAIWKDISSSGSWSFNKSHAVSYGLISYWTAYMKAYHPIEFFVATLNHTKDEKSTIKMLREIDAEGIKFTPVDPDESGVNWEARNGQILGGLTNLKGIGLSKARDIIKRRSTGDYTPAIARILSASKTPYDIIYPGEYYFGEYYRNPSKLGIFSDKISYIKDVQDEGEYIIIGCLEDRNLRDLNEYVFLQKRNMEVIKEDNLYLNLKVEDDTDMISCVISRWDFDRLGAKEIAEKGRIGKDWYIIKGELSGDWRRLKINKIHNLNELLELEI